MITRRQLMGGAVALPALACTPVHAQSDAAALPRLVVLLLRGGLDGLTAVPAPGDPTFAATRGALAPEGALPLDATFALHPLLPQLHAMYRNGELLVVHATGLPYRERSHFDAQQMLESGGERPYLLDTGWLGRALPLLAGAPGAGARAGQAIALDTAVPLLLRGASTVDTWAPSALPEPAPDLVARLAAMYRQDPALAQALERARGLREEGGMGAGMAPTRAQGGRGALVELARKAADFVQRGAQVAVLEMGGWDSHAQQAAPQGALSNNLRTLDAMLGALREGLLPGGTWGRTAVLVTTEFGREVAPNGTGGTDHGSGGAAFVAGGAVKGGRVVADWPGLAPAQRFEGRDLRITTDLRAVQRALLAEHLRLPRAALDAGVLPGSAALPRLDLLRG